MTRISRALPFAVNGLRVLLADRGMLFVDFFIATGIAFGIQYLVWTNVYEEGQEIEGFGLEELLFYCALTIFFVRLNNSYDLIEGVSQDVQEGTIEVHLARPVDFFLQRFFAYAGGGLLYLAPIVVLTALLWMTKPPTITGASLPTGAYLPLVLALVGLSLVLSFSVGILLGLCSFWLVRDDLILSFLTTFTAFLGGAIIPATFWPEFIRPVMEYNPFQYFIAAPAKLIVTGDIGAGLVSLCFSVGYCAVFLLIVRAVWPRAIEKYLGAGG